MSTQRPPRGLPIGGAESTVQLGHEEPGIYRLVKEVGLAADRAGLNRYFPTRQKQAPPAFEYAPAMQDRTR